MSRYDLPDMPYVEARFQFGKQKPTAILLRGSFTTSDKGAALGVAQMWHSAPDPWKAGHYTVDEELRFRCVEDRVVAGTPECADRGGIRIAVCAQPIGREIFWNEKFHSKVLNRTARLVAELSLVYKIPVRYLDEADIVKWHKHPWRKRGGIIIETPSGFPYESFLSEVGAQRALKKHI